METSAKLTRGAASTLFGLYRLHLRTATLYLPTSSTRYPIPIAAMRIIGAQLALCHTVVILAFSRPLQGLASIALQKPLARMKKELSSTYLSFDGPKRCSLLTFSGHRPPRW